MGVYVNIINTVSLHRLNKNKKAKTRAQSSGIASRPFSVWGWVKNSSHNISIIILSSDIVRGSRPAMTRPHLSQTGQTGALCRDLLIQWFLQSHNGSGVCRCVRRGKEVSGPSPRLSLGEPPGRVHHHGLEQQEGDKAEDIWREGLEEGV